MQKKIGTKVHILDRIFHPLCPLVKGYRTVVVWININFESFQRQVNTLSECTYFAYDLSRAEARYYTACIQASATLETPEQKSQYPTNGSSMSYYGEDFRDRHFQPPP